jgi:hypothetical protein
MSFLGVKGDVSVPSSSCSLVEGCRMLFIEGLPFTVNLLDIGKAVGRGDSGSVCKDVSVEADRSDQTQEQRPDDSLASAAHRRRCDCRRISRLRR